MVVRRFVISTLLVPVLAVGAIAQSASRGGAASIEEAAAREWLTYLASDQLHGRATYT